MLAISAFGRDIFSRYFIIITSTIVTNTSPIMAKTVQLWKICGNTNHKIGNVAEDAIIHVKIIFHVFRLSFLKNSLQRKNKIIVSNIIVSANDFKN